MDDGKGKLLKQMGQMTDTHTRRAGRSGEALMASILETLPPENYTVLNDLLLRTNYGTSQIDHLVVSPYMIFVIETKNYAGTVIGTDRDAAWTQVHKVTEPDGRKREERRIFHNPVRQNFTHVQALTQLLKPVAGNLPFLSIVAFPEGCRLQVRSRSRVLRFDEVVGEIEAHQTKGITDEKRMLVIDFLKRANITDPALRKKHAASVRRKMQKLKDAEKADTSKKNEKKEVDNR